MHRVDDFTDISTQYRLRSMRRERLEGIELVNTADNQRDMRCRCERHFRSCARGRHVAEVEVNDKQVLVIFTMRQAHGRYMVNKH